MSRFPESEDAFLDRLAAIYWGRNDAATVSKAWKHFSAGYSNYPLTNLFQYYGPMHDGPVWPLLLKPRDAPLSPTWLLASTLTRLPWPPSGDRIGESFKDVLTLDEVTELARRMSADWDRGLEILGGLEPRFRNEAERELDIGVARALGIQFRSGYNILRFYSLRERMLRMEGTERQVVLKQLNDIVREEIDQDQRLLALCQRDSRLGFHSEAEGYKYFPEKIRWRIEQLKTVLGKDVPELERLIRENQPLFPEYTGKKPAGAVARCVRVDTALWSSPGVTPPSEFRWERCGYGPEKQDVQWAAGYDKNAIYVAVSGGTIASVLVKVEPRRLWPAKHFVFTPGAEARTELPDAVSPQSVEGRLAGSRALVRIPLEKIGLTADTLHPIRVDVRVQAKGGGTSAWRPNTPLTPRLALGSDNPADLGWLVFEGN